jgi:hypothetical protein
MSINIDVSVTDVSNVQWLQSGGYADVFLLDGIVYKIFKKPNQERLEFENAKYILGKVKRNYDTSHICRYYSYGYSSKGSIVDVYDRCVMNGAKHIDIDGVMNSFRSYDSIPFVSMEYIPGMDGLVRLSHCIVITYTLCEVLNEMYIDDLFIYVCRILV